MVTGTESGRCTGIVLAGGRSSRMGRDKALLDWHGRPLIDHQIDTLRSAGANPVRVSGDRPAHDGMADPVPHAGPLAGLSGMAAHLADGHLLVMPVDMPRMTPGLLERLRTATSDSACLRFKDRVLPMRLRLDAATRTALDALMAQPEARARSLRALQQRVGTSELDVAPDENVQFTDCNTPEQWLEAGP
ncbi:molybdenum cofactor guanylyltransferase [Oleiagrimonas sp.]|uniref:molybdenum cofactor guanylyltransferase n=1 Tax=Oleiagrimonas sp. TaxID=2010330 RepID=UPI00260B6C4F|nr:molybdenum cofactor guanylyltransferase [Oleiagrimonas sp.]MDA3914987.1 molybdenum cofactor guanylyltransferase [Oleiagrimonas sp.]